MKFPTFVHWKRFFKILSPREKTAFFGFLAAAIVSTIIFTVAFYENHTIAVASENGVYREGVVGQPRFLNPVYADSNRADQIAAQLLFAGLLEYGQNGQIGAGLADYQISEDGKTYDFRLKDNLKWSDGTPITGDDAIYTIKIIQDSAYKSPLRSQWIGVETERISDFAFRLKLQSANASFLETCALRILPRHIWETTDANGFPLSSRNLDPITSGPYSFKKIVFGKDGTIDSIELERNPDFFGKKPNLKQIDFVYFKDQSSLSSSFKQGRVQGFAAREENILEKAPLGAQIHGYSMPRYFGIFFNSEKSDILANGQVRKALAHATDKNEILRAAIAGHGKTIDSPIPQNIYGAQTATSTANYDLETAARILDEAGYKIGENGIRSRTVNRQHAFQFTKTLTKGSNQTAEIKELQKCLVREVAPDLETNGNFGDKTLEAVKLFQEKYRDQILDPQNVKEPTGDVKGATREKLNQVCFPSGDQTDKLELTLTVANQEPFLAVAGLIKNQWQKIGAAVDINAIDIAAIERDAVKPRAYQMLLFGQAMGMIPDLYPFWHSSQKQDPGLNFSLYENKDADKLIEELRATTGQNERLEKITSLQELIAKDNPAILLYNPDYIFIASSQLKGVQAGIITDQSKRFLDVADWYTDTKRIWKK